MPKFKNINLHYDTVGSFLRPKELKDARVKYFKEHSISKDDYLKVMHRAINNVVKKQKDAGLKIVTDGEFNRRSFLTDTIASFSGIQIDSNRRTIIPFHNHPYKGYVFHIINRIGFNPRESSDLHDFKYLRKVASKYHVIPRQSVSAPSNTFTALVNEPGAIQSIKDHYENFGDFLSDLSSAYHQLFLALYKAGCRNLKIDDPSSTGLDDDKAWPGVTHGLFNREKSKQILLKLNNDALKGLPSDLTLTTHLCRGNNQSHWIYSGGYDYIADTLFPKEKVSAFFLEYDDQRSGSFKPLKYVPKGKKVVLGLVTSKNPKLENQDTLINRIKEAAQYVPLKDLSLSPQCGFASVEQGNHLTEKQQWDKIKLVVNTAKKVWH